MYRQSEEQPPWGQVLCSLQCYNDILCHGGVYQTATRRCGPQAPYTACRVKLRASSSLKASSNGSSRLCTADNRLDSLLAPFYESSQLLPSLHPPLKGMKAGSLSVQTPQYFQQSSAPQQYMPGNAQGGEQTWTQPGPPQQAPFQQGAPMYMPSPQGSQADAAWQNAPPQQQGVQGRLSDLLPQAGGYLSPMHIRGSVLILSSSGQASMPGLCLRNREAGHGAEGATSPGPQTQCLVSAGAVTRASRY